MTQRKLQAIRLIEATIELRTGLHIGAGADEMRIGGIDNPVLKHPVTREPYIPGSSIKGKMRHLLEWRSGQIASEHGVGYAELAHARGGDRDAVLDILRLFGSAPTENPDDQQVAEVGPGRLSFWDCPLAPDWRELALAEAGTWFEAKTENAIDRVRGAALHPRQTERVPAGARFQFRLSLREFAGDELQPKVLAGLRLLELDGLGGSGSRGYGKIAFVDLRIDGRAVELPGDPFLA